MSVDSISKAVSEKIAYELKLPKERQEVMQYGMIFLLSQMLTLAMLAAEAIVLKMVWDFFILAACGAILRRYSGGAHCSSPLRCTLLSMVTVPLLVLLSRALYSLGIWWGACFILLSNLISLVIYYKYAPLDSPSKPIKNPEKIKRLKFRSMLLSLIIFAGSVLLFYTGRRMPSLLMTLGSLNQAISLTKSGNRYVHSFDKLLKAVRI